MATNPELPNELRDYISAILGMKDPYRFGSASNEKSKEDAANCKDPLLNLLFQADSLWNLGESDQSLAIVTTQYDFQKESQEESALHKSFQEGLQALNEGDLSEALASFQKAAAESSNALLKTFYTERAVNIAFWMACSGSMLQAAKVLDSHIQDTQFAGGILSFAHHMTGDSTVAESIARTAISHGNQDPWTIHAVAHALTSQERHEECAEWLILHRNKAAKCNPFMKGHMEFHLALSYIYLKDDAKLKELIEGNLWGTMSDKMKGDYWNAAGLLNVLWKAELRGVIPNPTKDYSPYIQQALDLIDQFFQGQANAGKSSVFSLCIFRFTEGPMREKWNKALLEDSKSKEVMCSVAKAMSILYHQEEGSTASSRQQAKELLDPIAGKLEELGASPEQRETIDDFLSTTLN